MLFMGKLTISTGSFWIAMFNYQSVFQNSRTGFSGVIYHFDGQLDIWSILSIDWFKGKITGKSHDLHGKVYGFRIDFPLSQPLAAKSSRMTSSAATQKKSLRNSGSQFSIFGGSQVIPQSISPKVGQLSAGKLANITNWKITMLFLWVNQLFRLRHFQVRKL